jgi:cytochrome oxidase Cu insertion factor (SCO1/SenC/PrrC family)
LALVTVAGILAGTYLYGWLRSGVPLSPGGVRRATAALLVGTLALGLAAGASAQPRGRSADALEELLFDLSLIPLDGRAPPPLALRTLDGREVSLAGLRGRPALLYFWATW